MAAGIPQRLLNNRYRYRLQKIRRELIAAGVPTLYKRYQLFPDTTGRKDENGFNIRFRTLRASNGETAGLLCVTILIAEGKDENYGGGNWDSDKGIARIKELFASEVR